MVEKLTEEIAQEKIREAVREIAASENLQFFFSRYMADLGLLATPYTSDAIHMSYLTGRQSAALELVETFKSHEPMLFPTLLIKDTAYDYSD